MCRWTRHRDARISWRNTSNRRSNKHHNVYRMIDHRTLCKTPAWAEFFLSREALSDRNLFYKLHNCLELISIKLLIFNSCIYPTEIQNVILVHDWIAGEKDSYPFLLSLTATDSRVPEIANLAWFRWNVRVAMIATSDRAWSGSRTKTNSYGTTCGRRIPGRGRFNPRWWWKRTGGWVGFVRCVTLNVRTRKDNICGGLVERNRLLFDRELLFQDRREETTLFNPSMSCTIEKETFHNYPEIIWKKKKRREILNNILQIPS